MSTQNENLQLQQEAFNICSNNYQGIFFYLQHSSLKCVVF